MRLSNSTCREDAYLNMAIGTNPLEPDRYIAVAAASTLKPWVIHRLAAQLGGDVRVLMEIPESTAEGIEDALRTRKYDTIDAVMELLSSLDLLSCEPAQG